MKNIVVCLVFGCLVFVAARCPFPGLTANAEFQRPFNLEDEAQEAAVIEYKCPRYWKEINGINYKLTCLGDGSWSSPLPRCGLRLAGRRSYHLEPSMPSPGNCAEGISTSGDNSYSFQVPEYVERIEEFAIISCKRTSRYMQPLHNTTLDQTGQCSTKYKHDFIKSYNCSNFDPKDVGNLITVELGSGYQLDQVYLIANPGNHCGWPPIPLHADVSTEVVPGKTTNVTYKCNDPFVLDPNGPQFSTCDQLTGQWTDLPICISADPLVPADARIARTELSYKPTVHDYFVIESNGTQFYDGDQVTEHWTELPNFNCSDPPVPANAQIVDRAEFNVTYKCNDPFVIDPNGPQFSTCDQLTGLWTDLPICVCADPPVPANAQIVSRTDFSVLFQCDAPFPSKGNYTVVCDESGTWDQLPSCVLGYVPILAAAVIALPVLIVVPLLVWNLKIKRMRGFNRTKSLVVATEEMNPDEKSLRQSSFYEPPGWPSEEPIYESIDSELDED